MLTLQSTKISINCRISGQKLGPKSGIHVQNELSRIPHKNKGFFFKKKNHKNPKDNPDKFNAWGASVLAP